MCLDCQIRLIGPSIIRRELDMCLDCQIRRRELDMCLDCQIRLMGPSIIRRELDHQLLEESLICV